MDNILEKTILMLNFTNKQKTHFMRDYWFLNNFYMMEEMPDEWKNSTVIPIYRKVIKQMAENYREISQLNVYYKI
jgi:hypothetical protein